MFVYYVKPGSQYDAERCVASRHASLKRCRNATRHDHEADKDKRDTKCFSNLGDCRGLSKEARRWNQGSSQWQWLTRAHRGKLTSRPQIQKQTKQEAFGPWGKFVHVSNVYVPMHVEVQALHYTWNGMYRVDFTSACCQEGLPLAIVNDCYDEYSYIIKDMLHVRIIWTCIIFMCVRTMYVEPL